MRYVTFLIGALGVAMLLIPPAVFGAAPQLVNYQGRLTDAGGSPMNGNYSMTFAIYDDPVLGEPGNIIWQETRPSVSVTNGLFNVVLGSVTPLPAAHFADTTRYLGIKVGGDLEITPRSRLTAVAYAFQSVMSDSAGHAFSIADDAVNTASIEDGSINFVDIGPNGAAAGMIMKYDGAAWIPGPDEAGGTGWDWSDSSSHGPDSVLFADTSLYAASSRFADSTGAITDGAVRFTDIGQNGATEGQVMKWVSGAWAAADDATGGGWVDNGNVVTLNNTNDSVGIGTTAPAEKFDVAGNIHASGTIASGSSITIDGNNARITATTGTISLDDENLVTTGRATIGPGNVNTGTAAFVAGANNTASATGSVVSGGQSNTAGGATSTVGGGGQNLAGGDFAAVSGGFDNESAGYASSVGGGQNNFASEDWSTVGGGGGDSAMAWFSTVGGGGNNTAGNTAATVGGGRYNKARGMYSVVAGGGGPNASDSNLAMGDQSVVSGGQQNIASGGWSNVSGGQSNEAGNVGVTVAGGVGNYAPGYMSTIGGGNNNTAGGRWSTIAGGVENAASDTAGTVGGGRNNRARGSYSVVAGGGGPNPADSNSAVGRRSTVGGGQSNIASGNYATISGGRDNSTGDSLATVGGGSNNTASGYGATVAGGSNNTASGERSAVVGGFQNSATGYAATVGGGTRNRAGGQFSAILGGDADTVGFWADYSLGFGYGVYVSDSYYAVLFNGTNSGHLQLNRDHKDAVVTAHAIRVGTDVTNGNGAYLTAGGVWTDASSRSKKENFRTLDGAQLLNEIETLPVTSWNFKESEERHIGPVAEDFYQAFGLGSGDPDDDSTSISALDLAGVSLVAVQELIRIVRDQQKEIDALKARQ